MEGRPGPYRAGITDTSAPPGRNAYSPSGRREGEERRRRKQADIKRGSKKRKKRTSEGNPMSGQPWPHLFVMLALKRLQEPRY
ncbi:50S ribosomal protein L11 [Dissostichus eleginoides]|uniref:50S ribosomal protein L11 n=1 Tax=Dissostichus eleginoides TaxID=100907 RepID=A0AAD9BLQ5_DISEL|nr:50S ribosomal protein L11 [Dissostichus eleginoides]